MLDNDLFTSIPFARGGLALTDWLIIDVEKLKKYSAIGARDFSYGFVGLFLLDVSWRIMDLAIDFICNHISWLNWLAGQ